MPSERKIINEMDHYILSEHISIPVDSRITRRNPNTLVLGSTEDCLSHYIGPNILQASCSYVIHDLDGVIYKRYGRFMECKGYKVKCLDLVNPGTSSHYNPFKYIHSDKDIEYLVNTLISNTNPHDKKEMNPFLEKSETAFLIALIAYLYHYAEKSKQRFSNAVKLIHMEEASEGELSAESPLEHIFAELEKTDPEAYALKQYKIFKTDANRPLEEVMYSCAARLQAFDLPDISNLTDTDDIRLDNVGDEKTALFVIIPSNRRTLNFIAAAMYLQFFREMIRYCENSVKYSQLVMDGDGKPVRVFRAGTEDEIPIKQKEAYAYLQMLKNGCVQYDEGSGLYEIISSDGEPVVRYGREYEAFTALKSINCGSVKNNGRYSLPVHVKTIFTDLSSECLIDKFDECMGIGVRFNMSFSFAVKSPEMLRNIYRDSFWSVEKNWPDIACQCDSIVCLDDRCLNGTENKEIKEWIENIIRFRRNNSIFARLKKKIKYIFQKERPFTFIPDNECMVIIRSSKVEKDKKYTEFEHPSYRYFLACKKKYI